MKRKIREYTGRVLILSLILMMFLPGMVIAGRAAEPDRVLKVAFYPLEGFFEYDEQGNEQGYGVEILNKITQYSGIKFTYVEAESWESTREMVESGEADIRMPTNRLNNGPSNQGYTEQSIIDTYHAIMTKETRRDLTYGDYEVFKTKKIGVARSYYHAITVSVYMESIGISEDNLVIYDEYNDCKEALNLGKVDAVISNVMDLTEDMKVLARFNYVSNYISMEIGNPYLEEIDAALTQIKLDEPNFLSDLNTKYYAQRTVTPLTRAEQEYVEELGTLTFAFSSNQGYLCRAENGSYVGIYPQIAKLLCEKLGVGYKEVQLDYSGYGDSLTEVWNGEGSAQELLDYLEDLGVNVWGDFYYDYTWADNMNVNITDSYFRVNYYLIQRIGSTLNQNTCKVAAVRGMRYSRDIIDQYSEDQIVWCDNFEECLEYVSEGEADATVMNTYASEYYLSSYKYNNLSYRLTDYQSQTCMATSEGPDGLLASALNKTLVAISADETDAIVIQETGDKPAQDMLLTYFYEYPVQLMFIILSVLLLIIIVIELAISNRTIRRKNLELLHATNAKTEFLSRMSHDMRTPMNGIIGLATLMKEETDFGKIRSGLDQLLLSSKTLLSLINDTLDMNKIESGKLELNTAPVNRISIYESIASNAKVLAQSHQVNLKVDLSKSAGRDSRAIIADGARIDQILSNLISNAVKFTAEGGHVEVIIETISRTEDTLTERYIIKDDGIGMNPEFLEHIYEPFVQEGRVNTERQYGTGLGMSIVKQLVDLMGGKIQLESEVDLGTTFTVTIQFPVYQGVLEDASQDEADIHLDGIRVLLCEDHPLNRQIAVKILAKKGIQIETAENGKEGLAKFENSDLGYYDAVLMDIRMPEMDGIEATKAIRNLGRVDAGSVPIIAMTANAFAEDVRRCIKAGMNAHLSKPIDPQKLYWELQKQINIRKG